MKKGKLKKSLGQNACTGFLVLGAVGMIMVLFMWGLGRLAPLHGDVWGFMLMFIIYSVAFGVVGAISCALITLILHKQ
ncbi:MAG TPA: hypothetical protein VJI66_00765 [Candidatus Paceibacterota bacterium]